MKKLALFLICTAFVCDGSAQNFQAIQDNGYRIYDFGYQRGIDVDSTAAMDGDSLFYLTPSVQLVDQEWYCYDPYGPSWLGEYVRISPDGRHLFFNLQGDTIRLEAQASVGTSWLAFNHLQLTVMAEVVSIQEETIIGGITDSVKTISFQAVDSDSNPIEHAVNNFEFQLSENYGFLKTLNFVAFPFSNEEYYQWGLQNASLLGIEGVDGSVQNLTYKEVYDFQPGDELHIKRANGSFGTGQERWTVRRYLTRAENNDSITYSVQVDRDFYDLAPFGVYTHTGFSSSIQQQVVKANATFDQLPFLPSVAAEGAIFTSNYYAQSGAEPIREKIFSDLVGLYGIDENGCWTAFVDGACSMAFNPNFYYYEKRGGPYYDCSNTSTVSQEELVYYNIDGQEWGTPLQLILNTEGAVENEFRVYPTPAIDKVHIETSEAIPNARIEISDIQGRIVLAERLTGSRSEIEVGSLPAGVFVYRIYADEAVMTTGKILVQR
jgi:hypothetical protein